MALTPEQRDRIIALRLDGHSVREVAAETGHALQTVSDYWHRYLAETSQDRRPALDLRREELLQRYERNAAAARAGAVAALEAGEYGPAARFLSAELSALRRVEELDGLAGSSRRFASTPTVNSPMAWKSAEEALAYLVAESDHTNRVRVAYDSLLSDDILQLSGAEVPKVSELAPVALAALAGD